MMMDGAGNCFMNAHFVTTIFAMYISRSAGRAEREKAEGFDRP